MFIQQILTAQNLVPNPSFEDTTYSCSTIGLITLSNCKEWYCPSGTTSDYYNSCSIGARGVPNNMTGYQLARTGEAYCGIITHRIDTTNIGEWNEYIGVYLKTPLSINQEYEFKMYVNLADKSKHTIDKIGVLFSSNSLHPFNFGGYIPFSPQIENYFGNVIHDKQNWKEIKQSFIADSSYQVLTIGNFHSSYNTNMYDTYSNSGWNPTDFPYILIDDVSLTPINTICLGDSISLTSLGDTLYGWANSLSPNIIISNDSIITVNPNSNTIYYDYSNGDTTEFIVNVMNNDIFHLNNDTNLCKGQTLLLNAATSNSTYLWQDNSTNYKYDATQAGTYWVQVTNSCGVFTDTINITYNTIPVSLGGNQTLCVGQSLTLNPNIPNANYLWQNFSTTPTFIIQPWITQSNTYWIQVSDSNGCGSDTILVDYNIFPNGNILNNDTSVCEGDTLLLKASLPNSSYLWSNNSTDSTIFVTQTGFYWIQVINNCYTDTDSINIIFKPSPYFELGNDITLCNNEELVIGINSLPNAATWWNTSFTSPITVKKEGQYIATAAYQGCYFKDTINIYFEDCDINIIIPNVFTPNNDGHNDVFSIQVIDAELISTIEVIIYNRWGEKMYEYINNESTPELLLWDGVTSSGNKASEGTYFYVVSYKTKAGETVTQKGTVSLLR